MKFYLSSYKIGKETETLKELARGKKIGFIPNSLDYVEPKARQESNEKNMKDLSDLGIDVEMLDLKEYFGKRGKLEKKIDGLGGVWIRGGNTFVLRVFGCPGVRIGGAHAAPDQRVRTICDAKLCYT